MSGDQDPGLDREMVALVAEVKRLIAAGRLGHLDEPLGPEDRLPPGTYWLSENCGFAVHEDGSSSLMTRVGAEVWLTHCGPGGDLVTHGLIPPDAIRRHGANGKGEQP